MLLLEIYKKIIFCNSADRIGPDMPFSHWKLHFKSSMLKICKMKFKYFGENADFRAGAYAVHCSNISLGKNVVVRPSAMFFADEFAEIVVEDDVMMGAGVHFYVNNHKFDRRDVPLIQQGYYPSVGITVRNGAWIGANSIILPGVTIGVNAVIGAGSIVTKSIPDYSIAVGSPAKVISKIN
ncbi:acyltransferase [Paraglaciecola polaris]|uniref:Transferase hexapeptide repeat containing protein n=1 Tax=Paraglaciecola polaris LMG 21857 TaxID=1129793 RepID=K6ZT22_9ALTE|nr:acyltransferase [Paraglaciecola polaris]GAC33432.1 transferase hexapeptide repeat containing protein [Paraglaciecola polaris LMG 21857]